LVRGTRNISPSWNMNQLNINLHQKHYTNYVKI
jgi:hypothetical protein